MIKELLKEAEGRMNGAIQSLENDLAVIRTGRATPALVEKLQISGYCITAGSGGDFNSLLST